MTHKPHFPSWTRIALAATLTAIALAACGSGGSLRRLCVVDDASESTQYVEPNYENWLSTNVTAVANDGGTVDVVVVTGRPLSQSQPMTQNFSSDTGQENSATREADVSSFLDEVQSAVSAAQTGSSDPTMGSGIIEGLNLYAGKGCTSLAALTDGYENEAVNIYKQNILTPSGRAELIGRLEREHLTPDFRGVELALPFGGYEPQGSSLSQARVAALPAFWDSYASHSQAHLEWRNG
jgi:hypothetical protein